MTAAKKIEVSEHHDHQQVSTPPLAKPQHTDYGIFLLSLPVVGTLLAIFWVGNMALINDPASNLTLLMLAVAVGTAIFASLESKQFEYKSDRSKGVYSPTQWFFLISLMWIVGYPAYMFKRKHLGMKNHVVGGSIAMLVFTVISLAILTAIEDKKQEIRKSFNNMQNELQNSQRKLEQDLKNMQRQFNGYGQ